MDLQPIVIEPGAGKIEVRPFNFPEAEQVTIEGSALFESARVPADVMQSADA
jgi:hypothetical protein